ncbi:helix-turn-helix domain-containing protein, partial [Atlantibacter hermannii]
KLTAEQWAQVGRLIAAGESRQRVALIFDVGLSTLYRKFPAAKELAALETGILCQ